MLPNPGRLMKITACEWHHHQEIQIGLRRRLSIGVRAKENDLLRMVSLDNAITDLADVRATLGRVVEACLPFTAFPQKLLNFWR